MQRFFKEYMKPLVYNRCSAAIRYPVTCIHTTSKCNTCSELLLSCSTLKFNTFVSFTLYNIMLRVHFKRFRDNEGRGGITREGSFNPLPHNAAF